jgi:hypothetical protein
MENSVCTATCWGHAIPIASEFAIAPAKGTFSRRREMIALRALLAP